MERRFSTHQQTSTQKIHYLGGILIYVRGCMDTADVLRKLEKILILRKS